MIDIFQDLSDQLTLAKRVVSDSRLVCMCRDQHVVSEAGRDSSMQWFPVVSGTHLGSWPLPGMQCLILRLSASVNIRSEQQA